MAFLPGELLRIIFTDAAIDHEDLKSARQVCKTWYDHATNLLFHRVCLFKLKTDRDAFLNIAAHPHLAARVRVLVWYELAEDERSFSIPDLGPTTELPDVEGRYLQPGEDPTMDDFFADLRYQVRHLFWLPRIASPGNKIEARARSIITHAFQVQLNSALDATAGLQTIATQPMSPEVAGLLLPTKKVKAYWEKLHSIHIVDLPVSPVDLAGFLAKHIQSLRRVVLNTPICIKHLKALVRAAKDEDFGLGSLEHFVVLQSSEDVDDGEAECGCGQGDLDSDLCICEKEGIDEVCEVDEDDLLQLMNRGTVSTALRRQLKQDDRTAVRTHRATFDMDGWTTAAICDSRSPDALDNGYSQEEVDLMDGENGDTRDRKNVAREDISRHQDISVYLPAADAEGYQNRYAREQVSHQKRLLEGPNWELCKYGGEDPRWYYCKQPPDDYPLDDSEPMVTAEGLGPDVIRYRWEDDPMEEKGENGVLLWRSALPHQYFTDFDQ
ncbi:Uu.00g139090.m01.CDS01 [Anthostomella pinea]|uniref:Uu.00g139090.m01.CDS01 n=1 Tax=Anthostomella pinea TaxID=933095 RepID=A0AAI8YL49_9PEZI|nr:Uu.00g139090.m01.CDS01 [Anthostomella pinea]